MSAINKGVLVKCNGYTLIELLISLVILGIIINPLLTLFNTCHLAVSRAGRTSAAANLCLAEVESIRADGFSAALNRLQNNNLPVDEPIPEYACFTKTVYIQPYQTFITESSEGDLLPLHLLQIEVAVNWTEKEKVYSEKIFTLLGP